MEATHNNRSNWNMEIIYSVYLVKYIEHKIYFLVYAKYGGITWHNVNVKRALGIKASIFTVLLAIANYQSCYQNVLKKRKIFCFFRNTSCKSTNKYTYEKRTKRK